MLNKNVINLRGNKKEILSFLNRIKDENAKLIDENTKLIDKNAKLITEITKLKNANTDFLNNNNLINKNIVLLTKNNTLLLENINNNKLITEYKQTIENLKYEIITLKNLYNSNVDNFLDSDDE